VSNRAVVNAAFASSFQKRAGKAPQRARCKSGSDGSRALTLHLTKPRSDDVSAADHDDEHLPVHRAGCPATSVFFVIIKSLACALRRHGFDPASLH
jgi:hypothetical protein